jgi:hypothetical protein
LSSVKPPPIYNPVVDEKGIATLPYILFFSGIFEGDRGTDWTPNFVNLTETGTPTITGKYYRLSRSIAFFHVNIVPATNTTAVAGTTYIDNFPLVMSADGICFAVSGLLGTNAGVCDQASQKIYVPSWAAVTVPLTIVGIVAAG